MYQLNSKTKVDKLFKLADLLKRMKVDKGIKAEAIHIESVTLEHIIGTGTIHIKNDASCKEIFIYRIKLKKKLVPVLFIKGLDEMTQLHTFFVLEYEGQVKEVGIYRELNEEHIRRGKLYESEWQEENLKELPYCSSIYEIYRQMMMDLVPLRAKEDEPLRYFLERYNQIQKLQKDIKAMDQKAQKEKQPRRKLDLGREVNKLRDELKQLM